MTESAIGILATIGYLSLDFFICKSIDPYHVEKYSPPWGVEIAFIMLFVGLVAPILFLAFLFVTHSIGELVCGWMRDFRIDPRPRQRY